MTTNRIYFARPLFAAFFAIVSMYGEKVTAGFSTELYRRDSYGSPLYDPRLSKTDIIRRAITRSVNKLNMVTPNGPVSQLYGREKEYFMKIRLGTPPVDIFGIADTGSEIVWTQCQNCHKCVLHRMPNFNPETSSSYRKIGCNSSLPCPSGSRCDLSEVCRYEMHYANKAYTNGPFSTDILTMDTNNITSPTIQVQDFKFGCGTDQMIPTRGTIMGVIGLAPGPNSLVSQLGEHSMQKLSYCLLPIGSNNAGVSRIHFGDDPNLDGPGNVTLPLVYDWLYRNYFATLEAFTIGTTRVDYKDGSGTLKEGNIVFDSGTTLTLLPALFYSDIRDAIIWQVWPWATSVPDPYNMLDLCFKKEPSLQLPKMVANFKGGDVILNSHNVFVELMASVVCLAIMPFNDVSIYGNMAQTDFVVGFDYNKATLSLRPARCSEL